MRTAERVDPVVEVLAEAAVREQRLEVAVGGRDDAHVDLDLAAAAHARELAVLQHAQQLRLHRRRHVADLVEEERAAVRLLEAAAAAATAAPEKAPFSWPKSSLSTSSAGTAAQFIFTKGCSRRGDSSWMARATSSLPVPFSPRISTGTSEGAARSTSARSAAMGADCRR